jgi:hypothetical protein
MPAGEKFMIVAKDASAVATLTLGDLPATSVSLADGTLPSSEGNIAVWTLLTITSFPATAATCR